MKHLLKMVWNQWRSYSGICTEQILVTVVLMLALVSLSETVQKYRTPGMLDVEHTFSIGYMYTNMMGNITSEEKKNTDQSMETLVENLRKLPYVKAISRGRNLAPYLRSDDIYTHMGSDSIRIDDKQFLAVLKSSDEYGASVLNPEIEEGSWLQENRALPDGSLPVVITRQFADKAGWTTAVGKKIPYRSKNLTVVGVVAGLKQEPFIPSPVAIVAPIFASSGSIYSEALAKIKPGMEREFIDAFHKEFTRLIASEKVEPLIHDVQLLKGMWVSQSILPVTLQSISTLFLFIFAFIGTFGLYWMISQKRIKEFALRIAFGSTKRGLMKIVIGESLLVTCVAVLPALALSFFIYEYDTVHMIAIGATLFIMLLFAVVSAWYPAWVASKINPAEAMKYE
ncbi:MAG: ABC transporter permease [Dysgonamonadaceae bacterium]|jgi:ABC-type antimicrobial peptide transport system permease subunit|nr:ABC transporter permease [Dysgonamonadaceae bacterium]